MNFGAYGSGRVIEAQVDWLVDNGHNLIFIKPDPNSDFSWSKYSNKIGYENERKNIDFIIVNQYSKLLKVDELEFPTINFHSGELPYKRGKSSNLMSFINNDSVVVSAHFINDRMDDGSLIGKVTIPYSSENYYRDLSVKIENACISLLKEVIFLMNQKSDGLVISDNIERNIDVNYSIALRPEDGIIIDFTWPIIYYDRWWKVFGRGTGMFVELDSNKLRVRILDLKIQEVKRPGMLLVGAISNVSENKTYINVAYGYLIVVLEKDLLIGSRLTGSKLHIS